MSSLAAQRLAGIQKLYEQMPGAPTPPYDDGMRLWGEVQDTEHWHFCAAIYDMIAASKLEAMRASGVLIK
jgi:hypothetical protein